MNLAQDDAARTAFSSSHLDADGDGLFQEVEVRQAISMAVDDYRWPETYTPSAEVIVHHFSGGRSVEDLDGSLSAVGIEHTVVSGWHQCAWFMAWLDAFQSGDRTAQADALEVMTDVIPASPVLEANGIEYLRDIAESAALDDPAPVRRMIEGMRCNERPFDGGGEQAGAAGRSPSREGAISR